MNHREQWERFLNPEIFRDRLINISMYITIYEMLKDSIINRIKDFYIMPVIEFDDFEGKEKYKSEVLSKSKNHLYASIAWLVESHVIDENDKNTIEILKDYRNYLAHEMSNVIFNGDVNELNEKFLLAYILIIKIENWWITNFEIPINSDFQDINLENMDLENIQSGKKLMIDMALSVISGNDDLLKAYTNEKN
ncbi:DUF4145 domain-containing protein [Acinetobacter pragensis]|uniref:DUF4145 domain-containing protein n=1 Tax=Acinetobacter pragensis TaxID=1806892 RepID=UPI00333F2BD0